MARQLPVITTGCYDDFKRCAFHALDFARVAELIDALTNWSLLLNIEFTCLHETIAPHYVVVAYDFKFGHEASSESVLDTFHMFAEKTDCEVYDLVLEEAVLYALPVGRYKVRSVSGRHGRVAFLLDVPDGFTFAPEHW